MFSPKFSFRNAESFDNDGNEDSKEKKKKDKKDKKAKKDDDKDKEKGKDKEETQPGGLSFIKMLFRSFENNLQQRHYCYQIFQHKWFDCL